MSCFQNVFFFHHGLHLHFYIHVPFNKIQIFQILDLQTSENAKKGVFFSYKNNFVACKQKLFSWKPRICHELKKLHKLAATLLAEAKRFQLTIKNVRNNTLHEQNDLNS